MCRSFCKCLLVSLSVAVAAPACSDSSSSTDGAMADAATDLGPGDDVSQTDLGPTPDVNPDGDASLDAGDGPVVAPDMACMPEETQPCTTILPGICNLGKRTCKVDGTWGACEAAVQPGQYAEVCDNSADDDCDGMADSDDEDCHECSQGQSESCVSSEPGVCQEGTRSCTEALVWGPCEPTIAPGDQEEVCGNLLDDDCDALADEDDSDCRDCVPNTTEDCDSGLPGVCADGVRVCVLAEGKWEWSECVPLILPGSTPETPGSPTCGNGLDDDCDGQVDDPDEDCVGCTPGTTNSCSTGLPGVCNNGQKECQAQLVWGPCEATIEPGDQPEVCGNGEDDDCDGDTDGADTDCQSCQPGAKKACVTDNLGLCEAGSYKCVLSQGVWDWSECLSNINPGTHAENPGTFSCSNGVDDDCDGLTDADDPDCAGSGGPFTGCPGSYCLYGLIDGLTFSSGVPWPEMSIQHVAGSCPGPVTKVEAEFVVIDTGLGRDTEFYLQLSDGQRADFVTLPPSQPATYVKTLLQAQGYAPLNEALCDGERVQSFNAYAASADPDYMAAFRVAFYP